MLLLWLDIRLTHLFIRYLIQILIHRSTVWLVIYNVSMGGIGADFAASLMALGYENWRFPVVAVVTTGMAMVVVYVAVIARGFLDIVPGSLSID